MSVQAMLQTRLEELRRRVDALPREVAGWQDRTLSEVDRNLHFSQVKAIAILMDAYRAEQQALLAGVDPAGDPAAFQSDALDLVSSIIRAQRVWDFFRDKLDLRFSPTFKDVLWVTDTIAWDCYRPVMDAAVTAGIVSPAELREPPLTYLTAEFSPATWMRGSRPNDGRDYALGNALLPIPVIEIPWDHVENAWEFLTLHHEVGHDLEADLKIHGALLASLQSALIGAGVPMARVSQWLNWEMEIFADLVGLQLGGPWFAEALMHLLLLPARDVTTYDAQDPHPTHYPRVLMNADYVPTLIPGNGELAADAVSIADRWIAVYGVQPQFDGVRADFPTVCRALMDTPLAPLKGRTVRSLMPYEAADDRRIRDATGYLRMGKMKPASLRPRHSVSAARRAITLAAADGSLTSALLADVHQRAGELVRANAPAGLRAGDASSAHEQFIRGFAGMFPLPS